MRYAIIEELDDDADWNEVQDALHLAARAKGFKIHTIMNKQQLLEYFKGVEKIMRDAGVEPEE